VEESTVNEKRLSGKRELSVSFVKGKSVMKILEIWLHHIQKRLRFGSCEGTRVKVADAWWNSDALQHSLKAKSRLPGNRQEGRLWTRRMRTLAHRFPKGRIRYHASGAPMKRG